VVNILDNMPADWFSEQPAAECWYVAIETRYPKSMSHLIPERRTNKNGVTSTKWVRPPETGAPTVALPAPPSVSVTRENWDSLVGSPIDHVFKESSMFVRSEYKLSIFDYDAACIVNELLERGVIPHHEPMRVFNQTLHRLVDKTSDLGDPVLAMNDLAVFGEVVRREGSEADDLKALVNGLSEHFGVGRDYLHGVTDEERRAAVALITVITLIKDDDFIAVNDPHDEGPGGDYRAGMLRSPELAELIKTRPDLAEEIAHIVNDRGSDDAGMIAEVLDAEQKALRGGVL